MLHVVDIPLYLQEAKINLPSIILNFLTGEVSVYPPMVPFLYHLFALGEKNLFPVHV